MVERPRLIVSIHTTTEKESPWDSHGLSSLVETLSTQHGLRPVMATEIEFYLHGSAAHDAQKIVDDLRGFLQQENFALYAVEKERADEQYEVSLQPSADIARLVQDTERLKQKILEWAHTQNLRADFAAKPHAHRAGSGLHVHVHLEDSAWRCVYEWDEDTQKHSDYLIYSLGGLLQSLPEKVSVFLPNENSRARIQAGGLQTPTHICWGINNRSAALRLPNKPAAQKHIEHRVAGADVEVKQVIRAILDGIDLGLREKITPPPALYGLAEDPQYQLPKILID